MKTITTIRMGDGEFGVDADSGTFTLVNDAHDYKDYQPADSDFIRGFIRVTRAVDGAGAVGDWWYATQADGTEHDLTPEQAQEMIAGRWFPDTPAQQ